jgi:ribosomal protein L30
LGSKVQGTLESLGFHKRNQTVYHRHSPDIAGKILKVKELVEVENVAESAVRNKWEQRQERKAVRGYKVIGSKRDRFMNV